MMSKDQVNILLLPLVKMMSDQLHIVEQSQEVCPCFMPRLLHPICTSVKVSLPSAADAQCDRSCGCCLMKLGCRLWKLCQHVSVCATPHKFAHQNRDQPPAPGAQLQQKLAKQGRAYLQLPPRTHKSYMFYNTGNLPACTYSMSPRPRGRRRWRLLKNLLLCCRRCRRRCGMAAAAAPPARCTEAVHCISSGGVGVSGRVVHLSAACLTALQHLPATPLGRQAASAPGCGHCRPALQMR